jgi:aminocarboxymuconate-semialdehyde decarboxylase
MPAQERSSTRRGFLKEVAAGILFVGCRLAVVAGQAAVPRPGRRAPVAIRGRRIKTVDMHAHCVVPQALALLNRQVNREAALPMDGRALDDRLRAMDAQGIDTAVVSLVPNWYDVDRDLADRVITLQNESLAAFCSTHADRFAALASVALQFPDLAAAQLQRAVKTMGFRGVAIGTTVAGDELADRKFHPFWASAEELGVLVFVHPLDAPDPAHRLAGNGALGKVIGHPLETTLALSHLVFEGTLDRFPGLKICAAHGGGYLPSYMNRSDRGCGVFPEQCAPGVPAKPPTEYLKQMYFDSLVFTPEGLRHLAAEVGARQIVMGTDYPYPWGADPVDHILGTPGLSDADREAILGATASRLLGLGQGSVRSR